MTLLADLSCLFLGPFLQQCDTSCRKMLATRRSRDGVALDNIPFASRRRFRVPACSLAASVARFGARPTSETNQCRRAQASAASGLTALCASLPICPSQRRRKFGSKDAAEGNVQGVLLTYGCPVNASLNRGQLEVKGWSNNGFVLRLDTVCPSHALPPPYPSIDSVLPMI